MRVGTFIRTVDGCRGNGAVQDVINVMVLQGEALSKAAPDLVQRHHGPGWSRGEEGGGYTCE